MTLPADLNSADSSDWTLTLMADFSQPHAANQVGHQAGRTRPRLGEVCDPPSRLSGLPLQLFQQASAHLRAGEYNAARQLFDYLIQPAATDWAVWYQRGLALHALDEFELAIASYQRAQTLQPPAEIWPDIWYQLADIWHYGLGDYDQAIAAYDKVIALNSSHSLAWLDRGNVQLYGLHAPEAALASYSQAVTLTPNDGWLWYNRANALAELGFHYAAIHNYDRALNLHDDTTRIQAARQAVVAQLHEQSPQAAADEPPPLTLAEWQRLALLPTERDELEAKLAPGAIPPANRNASRSKHAQFDTLIQRRGESTTADADPPSAATAAASTVTTAAPPQQAIVVVQDSQGLRQLPLTEEQLTIGRAADCDIRLFSKFASRCHAVLIREPADPSASYRWQYRLRDGNLQGEASTNGLTINDSKRSEWLLQSGDIVYFGPKVWFRYFITAA